MVRAEKRRVVEKKRTAIVYGFDRRDSTGPVRFAVVTSTDWERECRRLLVPGEEVVVEIPDAATSLAWLPRTRFENRQAMTARAILTTGKLSSRPSRPSS
jgi:hypothetical protein